MKTKTVVLGMSGGVDSSVSALLLKQQGFNVIGLFMQNWDDVLNNDIKGHVNNQDKQCNVYKDFSDAKAVADMLDIKLYKVDFIKQFWNKVFKYTLNEYKHARTPNPDVLCNKFIKFKEFTEYATKKFKCDYIAMGHYARTKKIGNKTCLCTAKDVEHDQTYFLSNLTSSQLKNVLFPIGNFAKDEVREIAKKNNLPTWNRKNSTGICFIGERKFKEFLNNYIKYKPGDVIDIVTNKIVGKHEGVIFYTYGQNKGLGLGGKESKYFVCKKDIKNNIIYVVDEEHKHHYLSSTSCIVTNMSWISGSKPKSCNVLLRFRHRQALVKGKFQQKGNNIVLTYTPTLSITPGQFAVMYQKNICLGGGIVSRIL